MAGLKRVGTEIAVPAPGGNAYIWLALPPGVRLKRAAAQNGHLGSTAITLFLCEGSLIDKTSPIIIGHPAVAYLPLNKDNIQGGSAEWIIFEGDDEISFDNNYLVALFYTTGIGNVLRLQAGYE